VIPFHRIDRAQQHLFVVGELLQRADFTTGANDCDQIVGLDFFVYKLAKLLPDGDYALHRNAEIIYDQRNGAMRFAHAHGWRRPDHFFVLRVGISTGRGSNEWLWRDRYERKIRYRLNFAVFKYFKVFSFQLGYRLVVFDDDGINLDEIRTDAHHVIGIRLWFLRRRRTNALSGVLDRRRLRLLPVRPDREQEHEHRCKSALAHLMGGI
jgi:hypothetical protein